MKIAFIWACIFGATGIALGALGAHALKALLPETQLASFEVGVRYQMYHAFFLLAVGLLKFQYKNKDFTKVIYLTIIGVFLFSVSIYTLSLQNLLGINVSFLGPITPIGGVMLISAWVLLLIKVLRIHVN